MTTDPQVGAQVTGQRADVGPRAALDHDVQLQTVLAARGQQVEAGDLDGTRGQRDLLAGADPRVRPLAVDLHGADGARDLLDVPGELGDARRDRLVRDRRRVR